MEETIEEIQDEIDDFKEQGVNKVFLVSHLGYKRDKVVAKYVEGQGKGVNDGSSSDT